MTIHLDLRIASEEWTQLPGLEDLCQAALMAGWQVLETAETSVDVLLTDDATLAGLNEHWRGKSGPTDVLSFPAETAAPFAGDIAIAWGSAARDAEKLGTPMAAHFCHLVIHGLLHLFGHDHIDDADAAIMQDLERRALADLGYGDPYSQDADR
ncbi:MAG: rRNA maturation RNase YbeY [Pseudomonadota bacterium]